MSAQLYLNLLDEQRKELNDFPIAYAFSQKQLEEALTKLEANDISECCTVSQMGDIMKKEDAPRYIEMLKRHKKELHDLIKSDKNLAEDIFLYEMDNHEYAINWDADDDTLGSLCMTYDDLTTFGLQGEYRRARNRHMKHAEEWGIV